MRIEINIDDDALKQDMKDSELPGFDEWSKTVTQTIKEMCFPTIDFQIIFSHVYYCAPKNPERTRGSYAETL